MIKKPKNNWLLLYWKHASMIFEDIGSKIKKGQEYNRKKTQKIYYEKHDFPSSNVLRNFENSISEILLL